MRKLIVAVAVIAALAVAGAGGWWVYSHLLRDPVTAARDMLSKGDVRGAQLELRNAVLKHPENADAHFELGKLQLMLGDAVAAEKELKAARAGGNKNTSLTPLLARAYIAQQKYQLLLHELLPAGLPDADAANLLVSRSQAQIAMQDTIAARASATTAARLAPKMADAPLALARVAAGTGDRAQALLLVDEALHINPKLLEALGLKADLLRSQGDLTEALAELDTAVSVAPYLPNVRLARARTLLIMGEDSKARQDIETALKSDPKNSLALYLDGLLQIRAKEWQNADVSLQKLQTILPQLPRGEYYYALVKSNINQLEQASESIGHYVARAKNDADGFRLLARIELELGHRAEATKALAQAADLTGTQADAPSDDDQPAFETDQPKVNSPESLTRMAAQQLELGDTGGAELDLEKSLETQPTRADTGATQVLSALSAGDTARAAAALDRLSHQPKALPEVVGNLTGLVRLSMLDFAGAQAAWEDAVKAAPSAVPPRVNLARVLALRGKMDLAQKNLYGILETQPANRLALKTLVELLIADNKVDQAIEAVRTARRAAPAVMGLLMTEAALHARKGDYAAAYGTLDEAPLEQALSPLVLTTRAQLLLSQGKREEAGDAFKQILLHYPGDLNTRRRLIDILIALDKNEAAQRLADEGLELAPGNSALLQLNVALTYRLQGLDAALKSAEKLAQDPVNQPMARLLKGGLYMLAKKYPEAAAAYAAEMKESPFTTLLIGEASALRAGGKPEEATQLLRDWVAKQPDPAIAQTLASMDIQDGKLDLAEQNLTSVLAIRPNDAAALNNLAWIYSQRGDKRAHALANKAYLLSPSPQTADTLGWIMVNEGGQTETAAALLRSAAQQLPGDPGIHYHLAVALRDVGDRAGALTVVTSVVDKAGNFPERDAALKLQTELTAK